MNGTCWRGPSWLSPVCYTDMSVPNWLGQWKQWKWSCAVLIRIVQSVTVENRHGTDGLKNIQQKCCDDLKALRNLTKPCWKDVEKMLKRCWKDWLGMGLIRVIRTIRAVLLSCSFGRTLCSPSGWSQEMYLQLHNPDRSSNRKKLPLSTLATLKYSQYNRTNLPFVRQESPSVLHQAPGRAQKHKQGAVRWSVMQWFLDNSQISCICIYIIILYIYKYIILHILNILYITYIILYYILYYIIYYIILYIILYII